MLGSMILIAGLAAANQPSLSAAPRCGSPSPDWTSAAALPGRGRQVRNTLRLEDGRLSWNGDPVTEPLARKFLEILDTLDPQPLMVLSYSARTPCRNVVRARSLIQDAIRCRPGECLELVSPRR